MAKRHRERKEAMGASSAVSHIKLAQPDRFGPTEQTMLQIADQKNLFLQAELRQREIDKLRGGTRDSGGASGNDEQRGSSDTDIPPMVERILDTFLWATSLVMLHFTLDVLVQNQYAVALQWRVVVTRSARAFPVLAFLVYNLHRHPSDPRLFPGLPLRVHTPLRQAIFLVLSASAGCYLIHITNRHGYLAVMKQAPSIGCLWIWAIIELYLPLAVAGLACVACFFWAGGYSL